MWLMIIAFTVVLGVLAWVTIRGQEAWPFSAYPMFSGRTAINKVRVVRIALETDTGARVWWRSAFYRYPEAVGLSLKKLYAPASTTSTTPLVSAQQQKIYAEVVRLLRQEEGDRHRYRALLVISRTVKPAEERASGEQALVIQEEVLARLPLSHDHS